MEGRKTGIMSLFFPTVWRWMLESGRLLSDMRCTNAAGSGEWAGDLEHGGDEEGEPFVSVRSQCWC